MISDHLQLLLTSVFLVCGRGEFVYIVVESEEIFRHSLIA